MSSLIGTMQVLDANPVHIKALYRRGMAYMSSGDFEEARCDFKKVIWYNVVLLNTNKMVADLTHYLLQNIVR